MATGDTVYGNEDTAPSKVPIQVPLLDLLFSLASSFFNLSTTNFFTLPSLAFVVAVRSFSILLDIAGGRFNLISIVPFLPGADSMTLAQGV
ncbi:hypothetical protein VN97_g11993 [Penicillium thymicola]|uniref:Uncharacterized protein n=1 Tax=Penicillium thymicola TaxID=293382 RepID=A0AAI9X2E9_PENTH|nr:hypothetical protein VN97_g11993 [Penicillium thymicola]